MAKAPAKKADSNASLHIDRLKQGRVTLRLIGATPLYFHAQSAKAKATLLLGGGRKTAAERTGLKHDPEEEFRSCVYRMEDGETLLGFPAPGIKAAMATAALETPGVTKASVERLIFMPEYQVRVWGQPFLKMDVVKNSDIKKTPDIRTRAFLPEWCCEVNIAFIQPRLSTHAIASLLTNAGMVVGIGDFRQEKGKGSFGCFTVTGTEMKAEDQAIWDRITKQGRDVQEKAMEACEPFDDESRELLALVKRERLRRAA